MTPEQITDLRRQKYNATVVRLHKVHPDLMVMRVRPDFPRPPHKPGQYGVLGLGFWEPRMPGCQEETPVADATKLARRSYSISCSVLDDAGGLLDLPATDWIEFYVVLVRKTDKGEAPVLTPRLFMLREGDRLYRRREDHRRLHARPGAARRRGGVPGDRHRRGAAQLHAVGAAAPRPPGPHPVGLLRPLRQGPGATAPSTTS